MKTKVALEASTSYYEYDDGTRDARAGWFEWPKELDHPLLQRGVNLRLGGNEYRIGKVVIEEDGSQTVTCICNLGYNRFREHAFAKVVEAGWTLVEEFDTYGRKVNRQGND